jgi:translation elongation factor EF-4
MKTIEVKRNEKLSYRQFSYFCMHCIGAIIHVACLSGRIVKGDIIVSCFTNKAYEVQEIGVLRPNQVNTGVLNAGQVGYIVSTMRSIKEALVGDTIFQEKHPVDAMPGFKAPKPMVKTQFSSD